MFIDIANANVLAYNISLRRSRQLRQPDEGVSRSPRGSALPYNANLFDELWGQKTSFERLLFAGWRGNVRLPDRYRMIAKRGRNARVIRGGRIRF
jgi:hypothetical protein